MTPTNSYTATCWREGPSWVVRIAELDQIARTARLSQVEGVARGLVARTRTGDATPPRVVIDLLVPDGLQQLLNAAAAAREDRDRVSVEAVTLRRGLARRLAAEGFPVRDVAALLGLSIVRAQQLIGESTHVAPKPAGRPRKVTSLPPPAVTVTTPPATQPATALIRAPNGQSSDKPHASYEHEAFLFRGEEDFLAGTVPFVLDAVKQGQPVIVGLAAGRLKQLREAVGPASPGVLFVDLMEVGAPARFIPALRSFLADYGGAGRPVRGVGEPVPPGSRATTVAEAQLHEALLNLSVEPDTPFWQRCLYDAESLPEPVIQEAARSHPYLREGGTYRGSTSYGGAHHADTLFGASLPEPPPDGASTAFRADDVAALRSLVTAHAVAAGMRPDRIADLVLAVAEVATNSIRHGGGAGILRIWQDDDALVCEITDSGHITDPLVGRRTPDVDSGGGRGLWLANELCDMVQVRSGSGGTTVRLLSWI